MTLKRTLEKISRASYKVIDEANYDSETKTLTLSYKGNKPEQFHGACTAWYKLPSMKRCGREKEINLENIYKYIHKYGNPYPKTHDNETAL